MSLVLHEQQKIGEGRSVPSPFSGANKGDRLSYLRQLAQNGLSTFDGLHYWQAINNKGTTLTLVPIVLDHFCKKVVFLINDTFEDLNCFNDLDSEI